jgi:hypothetical protein
LQKVEEKREAFIVSNRHQQAQARQQEVQADLTSQK